MNVTMTLNDIIPDNVDNVSNVLWQNSTFTPLSQMSPHWEYVIM